MLQRTKFSPNWSKHGFSVQEMRKRRDDARKHDIIASKDHAQSRLVVDTGNVSRACLSTMNTFFRRKPVSSRSFLPKLPTILGASLVANR